MNGSACILRMLDINSIFLWHLNKKILPTLWLLFYLINSFSSSLYNQAMERFQSYPPWALIMCFALIFAAMLPLPLVFIARHFNWIPDGSNKLSVSYRKSLAKEASTLEDETEVHPREEPQRSPVSHAQPSGLSGPRKHLSCGAHHQLYLHQRLWQRLPDQPRPSQIWVLIFQPTHQRLRQKEKEDAVQMIRS